MEYDDNDFQSQNLHLAGEGSTNCPPALQSYALPKFDFDGHLRFDSLVETEVFLGIESSVANNWIEDFSHGSSGIEFSSSAVESCSISRRNNVWSEATSSESVEMLLKSVGQEEVIPVQTIFEESDACKKVGCIKQMDPNLKDDDNILTETGDVKDLHSTLLPDETARNLSGLEDVGDQPRHEDASQTQEAELPGDGNSSALDPNSLSDPVTKDSLNDEKGNDVNNVDFENLVDYPSDKKMHENAAASETQVDNLINSVQSIITSCDELNSQNVSHHIMDICEENPGGHVASAPEVEPVKEEIANEVIDVHEPAKVMLQGDSVLHTMDACSDRECPGDLTETKKCEDMVVIKDSDVGDQSTMICTSDTGCAVELRINVGESSSSVDPILEGVSALPAVERCTEKECPAVIDGTNNSQDVYSSIDTDNGGDPSKSNENDSGYGTENQDSNTGVLSGLDPTLKGDSDLHTVDVCSVKESLEAPADTNKGEHVVSSKDTDTDVDHSKLNAPDLSPMAYRSDSEYAVELGNSVSSCVIPTVKTDDLHTVDTSSDRKYPDLLVKTTESEEIMLSEGADPAGDQSNMDPRVASPSANISPGLSSGLVPRLEVNTGKSTEEEAFRSCEQPFDGEILVRKSEASVAVIEETKCSKGRSDKMQEVHCNLGSTCSSAEFPSGVHVTGASKSPQDAFGVSAEELNVESHVLPSSLGETTERCPETEVYRDSISGKSDGDPSYSEKETTELPIESDSMDLECIVSVSKGDGSSSLCEDSAEKELIVPTIKHDVDGSASADDVPLVSCDLASCSSMDVTPLSSENGAATHMHSITVVPAALSPAMESHSDCKAESAFIVSTESVSGKVSPMVESGQGPVCEAEKGASCDTGGELLGIPLDQSLPISVDCNTENQSDPVTVVKYDDSKRSTPDTKLKRGDDTEAQDGATKEIKPTSDENSAKTSANVTGDALGDSEGAMLSACLPEYRVISADPDHPICGSHKGFGTIEIPETKHEKGNIKDLTNRNATDTNVVGDGGKRSSSLSNPTENDVSKDQGFHTSDITSFADLPIGLPAGSHPFPSLSAPKIVEGPQTNAAAGQMDAKVSQEISHGGDGEIASSGLKGTTERKRRRASSKGTDKESAKKSTVKATTPMRQADKGDKSSSVSLGKSGVFQFAQPSEIQYYGLVDGSSKNYSVVTSRTSSLPDLNSSAPASLVFQQPFTDLQQVQLRAQIFVYGALIQGTAPDEAYMVSAYGGHDGGRSIWENAWRLCIERLHSQKSTPINLGTPLQSSSGGRADQAVKQTAFQGKVISSPAGRASTKGIPPPASPMIPISSPLWSFPTPVCEASQYSVLPRGSVLDYQQAHTPLHPFQTSPIMNIVGQNSSWMSKSPFRGPLVPSQQQSSATETNIRFSAFPSTESVLLTPVKETNSSQGSGIMHEGPSVVCGQTGGTTSVFAGVSPVPDSRKVGVASPGEPSSQPKSRKRKKISESKELGQISLQPQSQPESAITLAVTSSVSTSVNVTSPTFVSKTVPDKMVVSVSSDHVKMADIGLEQRGTLSKETVSKAKEARQQAEEASAHAAAAVGHSQEIWKQLDKQKSSRLTSDAEARLASAAVAVAAAAAVAKAAAAAANVASNAALQAVLMAREAYGNESESMIDWSTDAVDVSGFAASGSVLRAEDGTNNSSSIIFAAREAARRRIEAASAASKRAENMDAIVKAAELAAEAVSQAGTVVAMGDPLPLSELIKAGPEGYRKAPQVSSEIAKRSNEGMREELKFSTVGEDLEEEPHIPATQKSPTAINKSAVPTAGNDFGKAAEVFKDSSIMEGSQVEVLKEGGGFAAGWFTATVLSLQDGIACVCYTELQSDEGSGKLQEWVALDSKDNKPPKIRVARLLTPSLEGTRKRRREAMADYAWSVGDKVDAWIQNSWWEGVVTEKNKKDETILKVHFPAQGETSHVKAWHLRPSLIWKDGEWVEWSSMRIDGSSMEDGLPQEKRMKLGNPTVEGHEKDKTLKSNVLDPGKPEEPRLLNLSANEKVFNMGKNTRIENKLGARTNRTGLQKEGSVKFGIPKPKRKFMEVSKHYVANQTNKVNESNDSVKFAKYLMPQASGVRASKNTFKYDTKDKEAADNKPRGFRSEKQRSITDKTAPQKDSFSTDLVSASDGSSKMDHARKIKDSVRQAEGLSGKRNIFEMGSSYSSDGRTQGGAIFSSRTPSEFSSSRKAATSATAKTERGNKGNFAPVVGKLGKIVEGKCTSSNSIKSTSEVVEPTRRSNRRIQPTSRLLEGLQSSLSISKIPSASHDKARSQNRNISRGSNHD